MSKSDENTLMSKSATHSKQTVIPVGSPTEQEQTNPFATTSQTPRPNSAPANQTDSPLRVDATNTTMIDVKSTSHDSLDEQDEELNQPTSENLALKPAAKGIAPVDENGNPVQNQPKAKRNQVGVEGAGDDELDQVPNKMRIKPAAQDELDARPDGKKTKPGAISGPTLADLEKKSPTKSFMRTPKIGSEMSANVLDADSQKLTTKPVAKTKVAKAKADAGFGIFSSYNRLKNRKVSPNDTDAVDLDAYPDSTFKAKPDPVAPTESKKVVIGGDSESEQTDNKQPILTPRREDREQDMQDTPSTQGDSTPYILRDKEVIQGAKAQNLEQSTPPSSIEKSESGVVENGQNVAHENHDRLFDLFDNELEQTSERGDREQDQTLNTISRSGHQDEDIPLTPESIQTSKISENEENLFAETPLSEDEKPRFNAPKQLTPQEKQNMDETTFSGTPQLLKKNGEIIQEGATAIQKPSRRETVSGGYDSNASEDSSQNEDTLPLDQTIHDIRKLKPSKKGNDQRGNGVPKNGVAYEQDENSSLEQSLDGSNSSIPLDEIDAFDDEKFVDGSEEDQQLFADQSGDLNETFDLDQTLEVREIKNQPSRRQNGVNFVPKGETIAEEKGSEYDPSSRASSFRLNDTTFSEDLDSPVVRRQGETRRQKDASEELTVTPRGQTSTKPDSSFSDISPIAQGSSAQSSEEGRELDQEESFLTFQSTPASLRNRDDESSLGNQGLTPLSENSLSGKGDVNYDLSASEDTARKLFTDGDPLDQSETMDSVAGTHIEIPSHLMSKPTKTIPEEQGLDSDLEDEHSESGEELGENRSNDGSQREGDEDNVASSKATSSDGDLLETAVKNTPGLRTREETDVREFSPLTPSTQEQSSHQETGRNKSGTPVSRKSGGVDLTRDFSKSELGTSNDGTPQSISSSARKKQPGRMTRTPAEQSIPEEKEEELENGTGSHRLNAEALNKLAMQGGGSPERRKQRLNKAGLNADDKTQGNALGDEEAMSEASIEDQPTQSSIQAKPGPDTTTASKKPKTPQHTDTTSKKPLLDKKKVPNSGQNKTPEQQSDQASSPDNRKKGGVTLPPLNLPQGSDKDSVEKTGTSSNKKRRKKPTRHRAGISKGEENSTSAVPMPPQRSQGSAATLSPRSSQIARTTPTDYYVAQNIDVDAHNEAMDNGTPPLRNRFFRFRQSFDLETHAVKSLRGSVSDSSVDADSLIAAAQYNDSKAIQRILQDLPSDNSVDGVKKERLQKAFFIAAKKGNVKAAEILLTATQTPVSPDVAGTPFIDVAILDSAGDSALNVAIANEQEIFAKFLIHKASVQQSFNLSDVLGSRIGQREPSALEAICQNKMRKKMEAREDLVPVGPKYGWKFVRGIGTPSSTEFVESEVKTRDFLVSTNKDKQQRYNLFIKAAEGTLEETDKAFNKVESYEEREDKKTLLHATTTVKSHDNKAETADLYSPLMLSSANGHAQVSQILLDKGGVDVFQQSGVHSAISLSSSRRYHDASKVLIDHLFVRNDKKSAIGLMQLRNQIRTGSDLLNRVVGSKKNTDQYEYEGSQKYSSRIEPDFYLNQDTKYLDARFEEHLRKTTNEKRWPTDVNVKQNKRFFDRFRKPEPQPEKPINEEELIKAALSGNMEEFRRQVKQNHDAVAKTRQQNLDDNPGRLDAADAANRLLQNDFNRSLGKAARVAAAKGDMSMLRHLQTSDSSAGIFRKIIAAEGVLNDTPFSLALRNGHGEVVDFIMGYVRGGDEHSLAVDDIALLKMRDDLAKAKTFAHHRAKVEAEIEARVSRSGQTDQKAFVQSILGERLIAAVKHYDIRNIRRCVRSGVENNDNDYEGARSRESEALSTAFMQPGATRQARQALVDAVYEHSKGKENYKVRIRDLRELAKAVDNPIHGRITKKYSKTLKNMVFEKINLLVGNQAGSRPKSGQTIDEWLDNAHIPDILEKRAIALYSKRGLQQESCYEVIQRVKDNYIAPSQMGDNHSSWTHQTGDFGNSGAGPVMHRYKHVIDKNHPEKSYFEVSVVINHKRSAKDQGAFVRIYPDRVEPMVGDARYGGHGNYILDTKARDLEPFKKGEKLSAEHEKVFLEKCEGYARSAEYMHESGLRIYHRLSEANPLIDVKKVKNKYGRTIPTDHENGKGLPYLINSEGVIETDIYAAGRWSDIKVSDVNTWEGIYRHEDKYCRDRKAPWTTAEETLIYKRTASDNSDAKIIGQNSKFLDVVRYMPSKKNSEVDEGEKLMVVKSVYEVEAKNISSAERKALRQAKVQQTICDLTVEAARKHHLSEGQVDLCLQLAEDMSSHARPTNIEDYIEAQRDAIDRKLSRNNRSENELNSYKDEFLAEDLKKAELFFKEFETLTSQYGLLSDRPDRENKMGQDSLQPGKWSVNSLWPQGERGIGFDQLFTGITEEIKCMNQGIDLYGEGKTDYQERQDRLSAIRKKVPTSDRDQENADKLAKYSGISKRDPKHDHNMGKRVDLGSR